MLGTSPEENHRNEPRNRTPLLKGKAIEKAPGRPYCGPSVLKNIGTDPLVGPAAKAKGNGFKDESG